MTTVTITIEDPNGLDSNLLFLSTSPYRPYSAVVLFEVGGWLEYNRFANGVVDTSTAYRTNFFGNNLHTSTLGMGDAYGNVGQMTLTRAGVDEFGPLPFEQVIKAEFSLDGPWATEFNGVIVDSIASLTPDVLMARIMLATSASLVVIGNIGHDTLNGSFLDDTLRGGAGADTLICGLGSDTASYDGSTAGVTVNLTTGVGSGGHAAGDSLSSIENVTGSGFNDVLAGNTAANTLSGGLGNDTYFVDTDLDAVRDPGSGGGFDRVFTSATFRLHQDLAFVEELRTTNAAGTAAIDLYGSNSANLLVGNAGANILDGRGGADTMSGLGGNDTYFVNNAGDVVVEAAASNTDTVIVAASLSYSLTAGVDVEVLRTTASSSSYAVNLTGNALVQTLHGNAAANVLNGGGGADTMQGFAGNDSYFVDAVGDRIVELGGGGGSDGGEGTDSVRTSVSYTLAAGVSVETLQTLGVATTTAINLTGNAFAQTLHGNAAANVLNGGGGADSLRGNGGNDTYFVDNAADAIVELAASNTDTVFALASFNLAAGADVEVLRTTGSTSPYGVNLVGNDLVQSIIGNAAANVINGRGGSDTLTGFGGSDIFRFDSALGAANIDAITDYNVAADTIQLQNSIFTALTTTGTLAAAAFRIGSAAADSSDRIVYNSTTGALIYDANGNAAGGATQFAKLAAGLAMTNADFVVI